MHVVHCHNAGDNIGNIVSYAGKQPSGNEAFNHESDRVKSGILRIR